jgi:hypothetical protein
LFLAPQSDLEKNSKHCSKELREKRPNPGSFCFNAKGEDFLSDTRTSVGPDQLDLRIEVSAQILEMFFFLRLQV